MGECLRNRHPNRRAIIVAAQPQWAPRGQHREIRRRPSRFRPVLSERRNRCVDERRIQFRELLKAQSHRSEFARWARFNENVGALDQLTQLIPAVF